MLTWNVYYNNFNSKTIEFFNIFKHSYFVNDCVYNLKHNKDKDSFAKQLKKDLMYYFWSRAEWEIILSDWPPSNTFREKKIDVFDQVMLNWDIFVDYIWNNKRELMVA